MHTAHQTLALHTLPAQTAKLVIQTTDRTSYGGSYKSHCLHNAQAEQLNPQAAVAGSNQIPTAPLNETMLTGCAGTAWTMHLMQAMNTSSYNCYGIDQVGVGGVDREKGVWGWTDRCVPGSKPNVLGQHSGRSGHLSVQQSEDRQHIPPENCLELRVT